MNRKMNKIFLVAGLTLCLAGLGSDGQTQTNESKGIRVLKGNRYGQTHSPFRNGQMQRSPGRLGGSQFVDANGDGICDLQGQGCGMAQGQGMRGRGRGMGDQTGFVDANGDGVCDLQGQGCGTASGRGMRGQGRGAGAQNGFVDANGDGVCDRQGQGCGMGQGQGQGFVDVDNDGINDNSLPAKLNLTPEQKAKIAALRQSGPGPHFEALSTLLTPDQLAQLDTLRKERQAQRQSQGQGRGFRGNRR